MFDIDILRKNRPLVEEMLRKRSTTIDLDRILELDRRRAELVRASNDLREERNKLSSAIKDTKDQAKRAELIEKTREIREKVASIEADLASTQKDLRELLLWMPNMLAPEVPFGEDESGNVVIRTWGEPRKFGFTPKDHVEIGESLGIIDIARAAKVWGTRAYFLKGDAVFLELALVRYAMDLLTSEGFVPVVTPIVVKSEI